MVGNIAQHRCYSFQGIGTVAALTISSVAAWRVELAESGIASVLCEMIRYLI